MRTTSMRGEKVDFSRYIHEHGNKPAIGNASLNARGDVVDAYGNIVKTVQQLAAEYHQKNERSVKQVSIKALDAEVFATPAEAVAALRQQSRATGTVKAFPATADVDSPMDAPSKPAAKRKLTDSE